MKRNYLLLALIVGTIFTGCRKPNDAESLTEKSGAYSIISKYETIGAAQDVVVRDSLAYIAQNESGIMIVNISDPNNPTYVSDVDGNLLKVYCGKIDLKDSLAYITTGGFGISVVNVSDPVNPIITDGNTEMKPARNLFIMGDYLYTASEEDGVRVADIVENPGHLVEKSPIPINGHAMGLKITKDTLFMHVACGERGFSIYDISNNQQGYIVARLVGTVDLPGYSEDIVIDEDRSLAFLACGTSGLKIVDYSDTTDLKVVGTCDEGGYSKEILLDGNIVIMTSELSGVQIIDVSDANNPSLIEEVETEFALGVCTDDNYIYVADEDEGLIIIKKP